MQNEFFEQECKLLRGKPTERSLVYFIPNCPVSVGEQSLNMQK